MAAQLMHSAGGIVTRATKRKEEVPHMSRTRTTRTDHLTALIPPHEIRSGTFIEYRPGRGWFLSNRDYPRYPGDEGDFIAHHWIDAERTLLWLFATLPTA